MPNQEVVSVDAAISIRVSIELAGNRIDAVKVAEATLPEQEIVAVAGAALCIPANRSA
ncbi:MAG: hypothetical protein IH907_11005 [Proteobacteria bacterium]|nr:hypothetical protein [Pseudomonadota bacterium]